MYMEVGEGWLFYLVNHKDGTQVVRLGSKCLCLVPTTDIFP